MRITDLKVDGFGVWSGLEIAELSDQLNVFYGPNEAGKTTLMQFVRSVLYGFSPERRARYLPPVGAGRPGGTIRAIEGENIYSVSRHADDHGPAGDAAVVDDGKQAVQDERALATLLGEVDEPIFNNVFAIGLREIQELGTLSDTQAADELYHLALGLDRVSLLDVLKELETSRNRLLGTDDRPSLVTQLLGQRERLQNEIEELGQATSRYLTLMAERQRLDDEIARLEADSARLEKQDRELALVRALDERWRRRAQIDGQLDESRGFGTLPENALARFERVETRLAAHRRRMQKLKDERRDLLARIEQLPINDALCRQALRLEALAEQQQWIQSLENEVGRIEEEILQLDARRTQSDQLLGTAGQPNQAAAGPLSKRGLAELRAVARSLSGAHREVRRLRGQIAAADEAAAQQRQKLDAALGDGREKGLTPALAEAGELVSQLRKRVQLDERIDQLSRREVELEQQNQVHQDNRILPSWVLAGLGSLFVLGCALVLLYVAGLILPASLSGALGWPVGLVGVGAAAAAGMIKFAMERNVSEQLDSCEKQIDLLSQQIKQARADRDQLDRQLPSGGGPLVARLQAAEKALAAREELLPLQAQSEALAREKAAAAEQEEAAARQANQLRKQWMRLLAQHALPANLHPKQLREFARRREQLHSWGTAIGDKNEELGRRRGEFQAMAARIAQLAADAGITLRSTRPLEQLRQCMGDLAEQNKHIKRRDELNREMADLQRRRNKRAHALDRLKHRRQRLLRSAGTGDAAEFRRLAQVQAEAQRLRAERVQLAHEITAAAAGVCSEAELAEWYARHDREQLGAQVADERRATAGRLHEALQRRGEMSEQLKILAENRQLPHLRIELGILEKRLQDALDRWRVLAVCGMMLEAVRDYYEREHQPPALREASAYLQRLTAGRYTRVWTPLGQHALRVDDSQGRSLHVEVLSRGTREQLFLALRLALIGSYARRGVNLPLVLDDVLVNFDIGRAKAAAAVLRDFARQGHQILVFTCHEHISKLFRNIKAEVRQLPDNVHPQATVVEEPPARRARRRPEVPLDPESEPLPDVEPEYIPQLESWETEPLAVDTSQLVVPPQQVITAVIPPPQPPLTATVVPAQVAPIAAAPEPEMPRPARSVPRRVERRVRRDEWSAEEFAGELTDRVRRIDDWNAANRESGPDVPDAGDDAEAA